MKQVHLATRKFLVVLFMLQVIVFSSCAVVEKRESPWAGGLGFASMPGWSLTNSMSAHALGSYSRFNFSGGKTNFLQLGPQLRWSLNQTGWWVGGEAAYLGITTKYDNNNTKSTASGFTLGPVAGYRLNLGNIPLSVYLAPSYLHRSAFKINGMSGGTGSNGFYGRLGFDIHYMSLLTPKGR